MLAAISGNPQLITQTFTANTTWTATGVNLLASLTGEGQDGQAGQPGASGYDTYQTVTTYNSSNQVTSGPTTTWLGPTYDATPPAPYCEGSFGSGGSRTETCYSYEPFDLSVPATIGADTTAFGYTFPGGTYAPATPATYNNVAITANASYSIIVPSGGSVTITYYK